MKRLLTLIVLIAGTLAMRGQEVALTKEMTAAVEEGKLLYRSEMATRNGLSIAMRQGLVQSQIGGFFSSFSNDTTTFICYSKESPPQVVGSVSFDSTFSTRKAIVNLTERDLTKLEKDLYLMNVQAISLAQSNPLFKAYEKTTVRFIPIINQGKKKVYLLTEPLRKGEVIFGNDYLINFDGSTGIGSFKRLHNNIIFIEYGKDSLKTGKQEEYLHSHNATTGDLITATDVCTLMMYGKTAKWKQHLIVTPTYVYDWNCLTNKVTVLLREAIEKPNEGVSKQTNQTKPTAPKASTQVRKPGTTGKKTATKR